jgi:hypothetical protein
VGKEGRKKGFFFEKKNQKTFIHGSRHSDSASQKRVALFFAKRDLHFSSVARLKRWTNTRDLRLMSAGIATIRNP